MFSLKKNLENICAIPILQGGKGSSKQYHSTRLSVEFISSNVNIKREKETQHTCKIHLSLHTCAVQFLIDY
jgi:hypothetical protein